MTWRGATETCNVGHVEQEALDTNDLTIQEWHQEFKVENEVLEY